MFFILWISLRCLLCLVLFLCVIQSFSLSLFISNHSLYIYFTKLLFCYCRIPHFSSVVCLSKTSSSFFPTPTLTYRHMHPKQPNRSGMFTVPKTACGTQCPSTKGVRMQGCVYVCVVWKNALRLPETLSFTTEKERTAVMWYYRPHVLKPPSQP